MNKTEKTKNVAKFGKAEKALIFTLLYKRTVNISVQKTAKKSFTLIELRLPILHNNYYNY